MKYRTFAQVVALFALTGVGIGGWLWTKSRAAETQIATLEQETARLLAEDRLDREGIGAHLRALAKHASVESEPRLIRCRARLELALDRPQKAVELVESLVSRADASAEDLALASEIHGRLHAFGGRLDDAFRAMSAAERASEKLGDDAKLLFKAWQYGIRAEHADDATKIAERLERVAPGSLENKVVTALRKFDRSKVEALPGLLDLDRELGRFEPELSVAIVTLELQNGDESALADAVDRVKLGLRALPTSKELRHVAAVAFHARGDQAQRDLQLRWLLENAADDARVPTWRQLLQAPAGK